MTQIPSNLPPGNQVNQVRKTFIASTTTDKLVERYKDVLERLIGYVRGDFARHFDWGPQEKHLPALRKLLYSFLQSIGEKPSWRKTLYQAYISGMLNEKMQRKVGEKISQNLEALSEWENNIPSEIKKEWIGLYYSKEPKPTQEYKSTLYSL